MLMACWFQDDSGHALKSKVNVIVQTAPQCLYMYVFAKLILSISRLLDQTHFFLKSLNS